MTKFSCTMTSGSYLYYVTLVAEDENQAREMAFAETKRNRLTDWSVAVLEAGVPGPAQLLASGSREL